MKIEKPIDFAKLCDTIREFRPSIDPAKLTFDRFIETLEIIAEKVKKQRLAQMSNAERAHEAFKESVRMYKRSQGIELPDDDHEADASAAMKHGLIAALTQGKIYSGAL